MPLKTGPQQCLIEGPFETIATPLNLSYIKDLTLKYSAVAIDFNLLLKLLFIHFTYRHLILSKLTIVKLLA